LCQLTGYWLVDKFWRQDDGVVFIKPMSHDPVKKIEKADIRSIFFQADYPPVTQQSS
jgi:hypothetical protein